MTSPRSSSRQELSPAGSAAGLLGAKWPSLESLWPHLRSASAKQAAFLCLDCLEAGYGGAAGGGKSDAILAAALQYVDVPGYAALILRRSFSDLALPGAAMARSKEWLTGRAKWNEREKTWSFTGGSSLTFGYLESETDVYRYQSSEYQFIGFDELTQFSESQYRYLFSRLRRVSAIDVPLRMRWASNPGGVGHGWVKRRFIDEPAPGVVFVPARVSDNPGLEADEYVESLSHLPETIRAQLLEGDWGAFEGAAFTITADHLVENMEIPSGWERFESMDYGLTNPTVFLAWAADHDGNLVSFGSYYRPGLPSETAPIVRKLRQLWRTSVCWGDPSSLAAPTSTLNRFGAPLTIEQEFADHGLPIARANNEPRRGYTRLRELLRPDPGRRFPDWHPKRGQLGSPRWFIVERQCPELVEQLKSAPLQPVDRRWAGEMIDPRWEGAHGHAVAAARYGAMSRPGPSPEPEKPIESEAERIAWLQQQALKRWSEPRESRSPAFQL
jgi:hypothetical protein